MGQKLGVSTGGMEKSPARKKREAARRRAEERTWAARSGPVVVKRMSDLEPPQVNASPQ
jgi:hypothetical protein